VVNERSTQVGCALVNYKTTYPTWVAKNFLIACNYATGNIQGWPVYKTGTKASGCVSGADSLYPGLCKVTEVIDPNVL
jgi:hypothetical protein